MRAGSGRKKTPPISYIASGIAAILFGYFSLGSSSPSASINLGYVSMALGACALVYGIFRLARSHAFENET